MSERAEFHVMGQPLDGKPMHYTASGLDYVYLLNGFIVENDPDYGSIVTIQSPDELHHAVGLHVISQPRTLTGAEFRFLRKQMGFKQTQLASRLGVDVQTVANYEKGKKIPPTSDRLIRLLFVLWITPPNERAQVIKGLMEVVQKATHRVRRFTEIPSPGDGMPSFVKPWQMCVDCHVD